MEHKWGKKKKERNYILTVLADVKLCSRRLIRNKKEILRPPIHRRKLDLEFVASVGVLFCCLFTKWLLLLHCSRVVTSL